MVTISLEEYEDLKLMEKAMEEGLVVKSMESSSANLSNDAWKYCYKYVLMSRDTAMVELDKLKKEIRELEYGKKDAERAYDMTLAQLNDVESMVYKVSKMSVAEFMAWRKRYNNKK
jgi:hypothetical protein